MVVSVKKSKESPYFTLFEEDKMGILKKIIPNSTYLNRQECPPVYVYNGSMYLVNVSKFLQKRNFNFENIIKYEMPESRSVDIDTQIDWILADHYQNIYDENS
jgi:N-acylneuraminate cytidylyltransferase